jgi:hypothetical protein
LNDDLTFEELETALEIELESFALINEKVSKNFEEKRKAGYPRKIKIEPWLNRRGVKKARGFCKNTCSEA